MEVVRPLGAIPRGTNNAHARGPVGVVIVDADPAQRRTLAGMIEERSNGRFSATTFATRAEALAAPQDAGTIVIADLDTVGGPSALSAIGGALIATSSNASLSNAVAAMKGGASDFMAKPIGAKALLERLEAAINREVRTSATRAPVRSAVPVPASEPATSGTDFAGFVGRSAAMHAVYDQIRRMAPSRAPVFITGESGTGKEVCAEAIHACSGPAGRPFIALNCSAIPKDLMESEIFGHVRGSFTGASDNRTGAAELANGGTLFLDEIAEMDLGLQAKLLRFVQTGKLRPVGGSELKDVDVRIVCATNRDPEMEVAAGRFRADLFYRLHVLPIHLPPLRDRADDILPLAEAFLARYAQEEGRSFTGFDAETSERLVRHDWPGNVRELANTIRRIVVLADDTVVRTDMLPESIRPKTRPSAHVGAVSAAPASITPYHVAERRLIEAAISACDGNVPRAAAALEISPSTIYRKLLSWQPASGAVG